MKEIISGLALFLLIVSLGYAQDSTFPPHSNPEDWSSPRIYHANFDKSFEKQITIEKVSPSSLKETKKEFSSNKTYWFDIKIADTMKSPPWTSSLYIFNERSYLIKINIINHNNYWPTARWINEKLLYIDLWWGRVLGTYLIFDVEKEEIIAKEMIHDGRNIYEQAQSSKSTSKEKVTEIAWKTLEDLHKDKKLYYMKEIKEFKRNGRDIWAITFDLREKFSQKRDAKPVAAGGEIFIDVDRQTGKTAVRYGE